jgi:hypothetical protein
LSRRARGADLLMSRAAMVEWGQHFMIHSKSIVVGSSIAASVGAGCGRRNRSKIVIAAIRRCDPLRSVYWAVLLRRLL